MLNYQRVWDTWRETLAWYWIPMSQSPGFYPWRPGRPRLRLRNHVPRGKRVFWSCFGEGTWVISAAKMGIEAPKKSSRVWVVSNQDMKLLSVDLEIGLLNTFKSNRHGGIKQPNSWPPSAEGFLLLSQVPTPYRFVQLTGEPSFLTTEDLVWWWFMIPSRNLTIDTEIADLEMIYPYLPTNILIFTKWKWWFSIALKWVF